jgi:tetratricopeptide (TPR) repeat protein
MEAFRIRDPSHSLKQRPPSETENSFANNGSLVYGKTRGRKAVIIASSLTPRKSRETARTSESKTALVHFSQDIPPCVTSADIEAIVAMETTFAKTTTAARFIARVITALRGAIEEALKTKPKYKNFNTKMVRILIEQISMITNQLGTQTKAGGFDENGAFLSLNERVVGEEFSFVAGFTRAMKLRKTSQNSELFLNLAQQFYETHKPKEPLIFIIYILRKFSEILILFNLHEEALVYLNYLKGLFTGENYLSEFMRIYILFADCLLETNRLDHCLSYYRRALYIAWKIEDANKEVQIYERLAQYFFRKENHTQSDYFHHKFISGHVEPKTSKYRKVGIEKLKLLQERIRLKHYGFGLFYGNQKNLLKGYSHKINISFEAHEEDEDIIIDTPHTLRPTNNRNLVSLENLYRNTFSKDYNMITHKSVTRCLKNFLIRNFKPSRKRIIKDSSLGNLRGPCPSLHAISRKYWKIRRVAGSLYSFLGACLSV